MEAFRAQESGRKQGAADRSRQSPSVASIPAVASAPPVASVASAAAAASVPQQPSVSAKMSSDEYPATVQELVMNGFDLKRVVHAYELIGDNFDDLLAFLVSTNT